MSKYLGEGRKLLLRAEALIAGVCGISTNQCCIIRILNFTPESSMDV